MMSSCITFGNQKLLKVVLNCFYLSFVSVLGLKQNLNHLIINDLSTLSSQARDTSSASMSLVKMHSTLYDLSPRLCPPPWCPLHSGRCWSSEQPGRRGNKPTWPLSLHIWWQCTLSPAGGGVGTLRTATDTLNCFVFNLFMYLFSLLVVELLGFLLIFSPQLMLRCVWLH